MPDPGYSYTSSLVTRRFSTYIHLNPFQFTIKLNRFRNESSGLENGSNNGAK